MNFSAIAINFLEHLDPAKVENIGGTMLLKNLSDLHADERWLDPENYEHVDTALYLGVNNQISIVGIYYNLVHSIYKKTNEAFKTFDCEVSSNIFSNNLV